MKKYLVFITFTFLISCKQSQKPELVIPVGHMGNLNTICFSNDGKYLVTAGEDKTVKIWDVQRGRLLYDLQGHTSDVFTAQFDTEGKNLITISRDNTIRKWDVNTGKEISCSLCPAIIEHGQNVSPDGKIVITYDEDESDPDNGTVFIKIWKIEKNSCKLLIRIPGHGIFFTPDGKSFGYFSPEGFIKIADSGSGSTLHEFGKVPKNTLGTKFSPDGKSFLIMTEDSLKILDSGKGTLLTGIQDSASNSVFSHDGSKLAVLLPDNTVKIYEIPAGRILETIDLTRIRAEILNLVFSNDDKKLLLASFEIDVILWDIIQNKLLFHIDGGSPVAISPDGNYIAAAANYHIGFWAKELDQVPKIYDGKTGKLLHRLEGHSKYISLAQFNKNGNRVLTDSWDISANCWDIENGKLITKMKSELLSFESVTFSPNGNYILTTAVNETATLWDATTGKLLFSMKGDTVPKASMGRVFTAKFSPDNRLIFTSYTSDSSVKVFDIGTRSLKYKFKCIPPINQVSFNSDGSNLAIISGTGNANIWDLNTGIKKFTLNNNEMTSTDSLIQNDQGTLASLATPAIISPDGKYIITTINRETSEVWNTDQGKLLYTFNKNFQETTSPFSSDSRSFITSSYDDSSNAITSLVNITTGKPKYTFKGLTVEHYFSPDKKLILTESDGYILIWDLRTGKQVHRIQIPADTNLMSPSTYRFSWDGKKIISVSQDGGMKVFDIETGKLENSLLIELPVLTEDIFSSNERYFINFNNSSAKGTAEIFETNILKAIATLPWHLDETDNPSKVENYAFSPDGSYIFTISADKTTRLWDTRTGVVIKTFSSQNKPEISGNNTITGCTLLGIFSPDSKKILGQCDEKIKVWDIENQTWSPHLNIAVESDNNYLFTPDSKKLALVNNNIIKFWDIQTGNQISTLGDPANDIVSVNLSADGTKAIITLGNSSASFWNINTGKLIHRFDTILPELKASEPSDYYSGVGSLYFSPDNKYLVTLGGLKIWDAEKGKLLHSLPDLYAEGIADNPFSPDGKSIAVDIQSIDTNGTEIRQKTEIIDIESGEIKIKVDGSSDPPNCIFTNPFSPDGKNILTYSDKKKIYSLWDASSGEKRFDLNWKDSVRIGSSTFYSPDGKYLLTSSLEANDQDYIIRYFYDIWDAKTGKRIRTIDLGVTRFKDINWNNEKILSILNSMIRITDMKSGKEVASFVAIGDNDYVFVLPTGEYMGTPGAVKYLSWRLDNKLYDFEQWDLQYNRPDKVLEQLGNKDTALISMYRKAYLKRLKRAGFSEEMFSSEMHTPEVKILNPQDFAAAVSDPQKELKINLTDSKYKLDRINVWINDVPIYGKNGFSLRNDNTKSIEKNIPVTLSAGINKIQVSGLNEKGVESLKESAEIVYNPVSEIKPDLHIIAMSVSLYKDDRYNLQYSVKDGRDIVTMFKSKSTGKKEFNNIFIDTLFNNDAIKENFFNLREELLKTDINDQVVVFLSGHGLLDNNMDFYYATYDIDFDHPEKRGISFEDLEDLLDSIPAREKLMMMDACHSGEVDKEEGQEFIAMNTVSSSDITFRGKVKEYNFKGVDNTISQSGTNLRSSFELMQELFSSLDKGTGTIVISAAAGKGYALESPQWNNGVFTYTILNGLKNKAADINKDQNITISELKDYSIKQVEELTGGRQRPTARKESITFDWKVW